MADNSIIVKLQDFLDSINVSDVASDNAILVQMLELVDGVVVNDGDVIRISVGQGIDGREVEMRKTDTELQWHYVGQSTWTTLLSLSELSESIFKSYDVMQSFPALGDSRSLYLDKSNAKLYFWDNVEEHYVNVSIPDFDFLDPND